MPGDAGPRRSHTPAGGRPEAGTGAQVSRPCLAWLPEPPLPHNQGWGCRLSQPRVRSGHTRAANLGLAPTGPASTPLGSRLPSGGPPAEPGLPHCLGPGHPRTSDRGTQHRGPLRMQGLTGTQPGAARPPQGGERGQGPERGSRGKPHRSPALRMGEQGVSTAPSKQPSPGPPWGPRRPGSGVGHRPSLSQIRSLGPTSPAPKGLGLDSGLGQ